MNSSFPLLFASFCLIAPQLLCAESECTTDGFDLFRDLELVREINCEVNDQLPFFYNFSMMGGYFNMPSGRMGKTGVIGAGGALVHPYTVYGVNFQVYDRLELSANYRIYNGITEANFGKQGFGDDAERVGNIKVGLLTPQDGFPDLPTLVVGAEDFIGTKRFNSQYVVMTKQFLRWDLEASLGWGNGRIKGVFGGLAWTPFRRTGLFFLKDLTLLAEYDATNYKSHHAEHPSGRKVDSRINAGLNFVGWDTLQLSLAAVRGREIAGSASLRYPLGSTNGFFPKVKDATPYNDPVDTEPLGVIRTERDLGQELAYAFADQGLDLYTAYIVYGENDQQELWIKVVNNRYREERVVRQRIQHVLAALTPSNIQSVLVVVEADALPCQAYRFRTEDLFRWKEAIISDFELEMLAPMRDAPKELNEFDGVLVFERRKPIWSFTIRPRLLTFFGSTTGKFKYNLSGLAAQDGYIFNQVYYKLQVSYAISSSMAKIGGPDMLNPSKLPIVRSDSLLYYKSNSFSMEQAFMQRGWNLKKGWFYRLALGYFEPAYGGIATEFLYYPARSNWAIGFEFASVWKRHYHGIAFKNTTLQLKHGKYETIPFVGIQYFLTGYYDFKPLNMDFIVNVGQFLARDLGVRLEVGRYFKSGVRFALWYTLTNACDKVNGSNYHEKGFSFQIPLDIFLRQSSRNYLAYALSAWLRDSGARALTGKPLYWTLEEERYSYE